MQNFYIFKSGKLKRKSNTLYLIYKEKEKKITKSLPIHSIGNIFIFGEIGLNSRTLNFLAHKKIPIHFFNYKGFYTGSFMPRTNLRSGFLLVNQVKFYLDLNERLKIAKEIVNGAIHNTLKNLIYYKKHSKNLDTEIEHIQKLQAKINEVSSISELMAIEGNVKHVYYGSFEKILPQEFIMEKRTRRPPQNMINALISFGNSLLYTTCLGEIFRTQLEPTISFLHEPGERRFSLSLDIAEIFKPIIVDKIIFKLINNKMIKESHFLQEINYIYLNEKGKRIFLEEYDNRLNQTIQHPRMKRSVSYKTIIRLECYKLIKHLVGDEEYKSFKMWW